MIQASLLKNSFSDYPSLLSCVLFLAGCNMRCPYCHNSQLALNTETNLEEWPVIYQFLKARAGQLQGVVLSGGEALLNPYLPEIAHQIKALGYRLKADTNGTLPKQLLTLLPYLDYVAVDIKTAEHLALTGLNDEPVWQSLNLLNQSEVSFEVRAVVSPHFCGEVQLTTALKHIKAGRALGLRLLPFRPINCLDDSFNNLPATNDSYLAKLKTFIETEGVKALGC
ncbi:MAG: anaerobic ribonucleoside-triphosphate reductase activating protein [Spirochaetaceae bacterium]|nr:anaerobic ribonucleoside-triphosphate reductase activating protein [Spirochaetaceae bacterium]